jgi:hypothetical protein
MVSQERSVEAWWAALIEGTPPDCVLVPLLGGDIDTTVTETAPDLGPFSAEVSVGSEYSGIFPEFNGIPFARGSQESEVSQTEPTVIQAVGSHSAWPPVYPFPVGIEGCALYCSEMSSSGESRFSMTFEVDEPTPYDVSGSLGAYTQFEASVAIGVTLEQEGGPVLHHWGNSWYVSSWSDPYLHEDHIDFAESGALAPGVYTVSAYAYGSAHSSKEYDPRLYDGRSGASYSLTLQLHEPPEELPGLGPASRLLLIGLLPLLGAKATRLRASRRE